MESISLDASQKRGFGAMINHSSNPNAESICAVDRGVEQAIVIATKFIPKGQQILIDYSNKFWHGDDKQKLENMDLIPPLPL